MSHGPTLAHSRIGYRVYTIAGLAACSQRVHVQLLEENRGCVCDHVWSNFFCPKCIFETLPATGAAGTDWLHNLVCSLCLAPWMADSSTHWHAHTHMHACTYLPHPLQMALVLTRGPWQTVMWTHLSQTSGGGGGRSLWAVCQPAWENAPLLLSSSPPLLRCSNAL